MKFNFKIIFIFSLLFFVSVIDVQAQKVRASQKGTVSQLIANTEIAIEYSRPVARGRILFGDKGIVKYKKMWMPGANEATNIKFNNDLLINENLIKAGRYSIWAIPNDKKWTIIFSTDWDQWHTVYPGKDKDALRLEISPEEGSHMEVLAFYFPEVTKSSAKLRLHWGKTIIPFKINLIKG